MTYIYKTLLILLLLFAPLSVHKRTLDRYIASDKTTLFGHEFTFKPDDLVEGSRSLGEAVNQLKEKILSSCDGCYYDTLINDKYPSGRKVIMWPNSDFWIHAHVDFSVVEVNVPPLTIEDPVMLERIQRLVFENAFELSLFPDLSTGGGHIHIDVATAFGNDSQLFRNFVVDFLNHYELSQGLFRETRGNTAKPFHELPINIKRQIVSVIEEFDEKPISIKKFSKKISKILEKRNIGGSTYPGKAIAMSFFSVARSEHFETLEIRSLRPPQSIRESQMMMELFDARIRLLKKQKKKVPFSNRSLLSSTDPQKLLDNFIQYVTESGLDWVEYMAVLPYRKYDSLIWKRLGGWNGPDSVRYLLTRLDITSNPGELELISNTLYERLRKVKNLEIDHYRIVRKLLSKKDTPFIENTPDDFMRLLKFHRKSFLPDATCIELMSIFFL